MGDKCENWNFREHKYIQNTGHLSLANIVSELTLTKLITSSHSLFSTHQTTKNE